MGESLKGKVALVPGSGQGIGRAIAKALAAEGAKVITNNRKPWNGIIEIDKDKMAKLTPEVQEWALKEYAKYYGDADRTAADIVKAGGEATACYGDISNWDDAKRLVETTISTYGSIDIIVNVASAFGFCPIEKMPKSLWDQVNTTKPTGYFNVIRNAIQYMMDKKWGRIVNCASPAWTGGDLRQSEYCAANAGVVGFTYGLAAELKAHNITVNAFAPAAKTRASVDMEIFDKMDKEETSTISGGPIISYDGTADPELFAGFIAWLCTEGASDVSGQVFMTMGKFIGRYAIPTIAGAMFTDTEWTVESAAANKEKLFSNAPPAFPGKK